MTEQPAGFRTHMLVGVGAGPFAILSAYGFETVLGGEQATHENADASRIASQIIVGIGFLHHDERAARSARRVGWRLSRAS